MLFTTLLLTRNDNGGQRSVRFSGGNARERTCFVRSPVAFTRWPDYSSRLKTCNVFSTEFFEYYRRKCRTSIGYQPILS